MAALPVLGMGAATLFTVSVGVLAPFLIEDLSVSRTQLGLLVTCAYVAAAAAAPFAGRFVDRFGVRLSMVLLFVVSSSALALLAGVPVYVVALSAAVLAGLGEAANTPFTNRLVQAIFRQRYHGIVLGAKQSGVKGSHLVAAAVLPALALRWGWQASLLVFAAVAVCGAPAAAILLRNAPRGQQRPSQRDVIPLGRDVRTLTAYAGLMAIGQAPVQTYLPLFGTEAVGLSVQTSAMTLAVSSGVAIGARLAWGALASRIRSLAPVLVLIAAGSGGSVLTIAAAQWAGGGTLWVGAVAFGATAAVWSTLVYLQVLRTTTPEATGWVSGIVHTAFLLGLGLSPVIFGWIVDSFGSYAGAWLLSAGAFTAAAILVAVRRGRPRGA